VGFRRCDRVTPDAVRPGRDSCRRAAPSLSDRAARRPARRGLLPQPGRPAREPGVGGAAGRARRAAARARARDACGDCGGEAVAGAPAPARGGGDAAEAEAGPGTAARVARVVRRAVLAGLGVRSDCDGIAVDARADDGAEAAVDAEAVAVAAVEADAETDADAVSVSVAGTRPDADTRTCTRAHTDDHAACCACLVAGERPRRDAAAHDDPDADHADAHHDRPRHVALRREHGRDAAAHDDADPAAVGAALDIGPLLWERGAFADALAAAVGRRHAAG
jgi:hypothetical protein